jgi:hypothetical protein
VGFGQGADSVVGVITGSPCWYIRGGPQTTVSDVSDPTERHTSQTGLQAHRGKRRCGSSSNTD